MFKRKDILLILVLIICIVNQMLLIQKKREEKECIETAAALTYNIAVIAQKQKFNRQISQQLNKNKERLKAAAEIRASATAAFNKAYAKPPSFFIDIISYAKQFIGNPYVWGGNSLTNGCDCSHFVWNVLKNTGYYNGGYTSSRGWVNLGQKVDSIEQAKAGDVIVYSGHVGFYDGKGKLVQAQCKKAGITDTRAVNLKRIIAIRRFIK